MAQFRQQHHSLNGTSASSSDHLSIGIRAGAPHKAAARLRRSARSEKARRLSIGSVIIFVLSIILFVTVLAYYYVSGVSQSAEINGYSSEEEDLRKDLDFITNVTRTDTHRILKFGNGSVAHGRDSRYWDTDDRRRDDDYNEDSVEQSSSDSRADSLDKRSPVKGKFKNKEASLDPTRGSDHRGVGLYNEAGRNELKVYEAEYEASLNNLGLSGKGNKNSNHMFDESNFKMHEEDGGDEYNDDIDGTDFQIDNDEDSGHDEDTRMNSKMTTDEDDSHSSSFQGIKKALSSTKDVEKAAKPLSKAQDSSVVVGKFHHVSSLVSKSTKSSRSDSKRKSKRRKFSGSCDMLLLNSTVQLVEPLETRKFARFSLQFTEMEEKPEGGEQWEPRFSGHQSLQERESSFLAHDQRINCGFVRGPKGSSSTGFDLAEDDTNYISRCHIAVISCIFGNSDRLRLPVSKMVTRLSRKNVCFVMFMDQITLQTLSSEGQSPDRSGFVGLWRIVVVKNLPYDDMRRVGKIPKLLPHRLFPSARYSIWLDSKLRLQLDPLLILEYFLWRKGHEYAISNHYDRHCVWEEVAQNKKLNKYNHTIIDEQFAFYQADGLKRFNALDPEKLLPSNVPEGSLIVRAHTPMSNLFSCLWFNEVDRFTPRDQLSFAYTYQKLRRMNPSKPFYLNMFKDCERRKVAKLFHHRSEEKRNVQQEML